MTWYGGYKYRKKIPITGNGSLLTDYVMKLNVYNTQGTDSAGTVYLGNKNSFGRGLKVKKQFDAETYFGVNNSFMNFKPATLQNNGVWYALAACEQLPELTLLNADGTEVIGWQKTGPANTYGSYQCIAVGDLNGDGNNEVVWGTTGSYSGGYPTGTQVGNMYVYDHSGNLIDDYTTRFTGNFNVCAVQIGNTYGTEQRIIVAQDGSRNLVCYKIAAGQLSQVWTKDTWQWNTGTHILFNFHGGVLYLVLADIDGDGKDEILMSGPGDDSGAFYAIKDNGASASVLFYANNQTLHSNSIAFANTEGGSTMDVACALNTNTVQVWRYNGSAWVEKYQWGGETNIQHLQFCRPDGTNWWLAVTNKSMTESISDMLTVDSVGMGPSQMKYVQATYGTVLTKIFGYDTAGAGSNASNTAVQFNKWTASYSTNIEQIKVYSKSTCNIKLAVYNDSAGSPGTKLYDCGVVAVTANQWNTVTIGTPFAVTSGTVYWFGYISQNVGGVAYDSGGSAVYKTVEGQTYAGWTFGDNPSPLSTWSNTSFSIYAMGQGAVAWNPAVTGMIQAPINIGGSFYASDIDGDGKDELFSLDDLDNTVYAYDGTMDIEHSLYIANARNGPHNYWSEIWTPEQATKTGGIPPDYDNDGKPDFIAGGDQVRYAFVIGVDPTVWAPIDIRFTTEGGTPLSYFWEPGTTSPAIFHVKCDSIVAAGDTNFYIYYGKSNDFGNSKVEDTFIEHIDSGKRLHGLWDFDTSGNGTGQRKIFGYESTGGSAGLTSTNVWYHQYTANKSVSVTNLKVYSGIASGNVKICVFNDNGSNAPGTILYNHGEAAVVSGWNTITVGTPFSVTSGTKYWIGVINDTLNLIRWDAGGAAFSYLTTPPASYAAFSFTANPTVTSSSARSASVYAYVTLNTITSADITGMTSDPNMVGIGSTASAGGKFGNYYVQAADEDGYILPNKLADSTYSVLMRAYKDSIGVAQTLLDKMGDNVNRNFLIDIDATGHASLKIGTAGSYTTATTGNTLSATTWATVAATFDGLTQNVYLDGDTANKGTFAWTGNAPASNLYRAYVGCLSDLSAAWVGRVDDIAILPKRVLTETEITNIVGNFWFATDNYLGRLLVRKRAATEPTWAAPGVIETNIHRMGFVLIQDPGIV